MTASSKGDSTLSDLVVSCPYRCFGRFYPDDQDVNISVLIVENEDGPRMTRLTACNTTDELFLEHVPGQRASEAQEGCQHADFGYVCSDAWESRRSHDREESVRSVVVCNN